MKLLGLLLAFATTCQPVCAEERAAIVTQLRVPQGGIQPQVVVGKNGDIHMVYFKGKAAHGDVFYVHSNNGGRSFSDPIRVNSQPESAIAVGTIRGAHLALGKNDLVHVAWNGSSKATPKGLPNPQLPEDSPYRKSTPMLYARQNVDATRFERQRNLMTSTYALDGGGSVGADRIGNVYVAWHANSVDDSPGEEARAVWIAKSTDDGKTFAAETRANTEPTGACSCCGLRAAVDRKGRLFVLYRSASKLVNRDMYLLMSESQADSFKTTKLDDWQIGQCMMSSAALNPSQNGMLATWETERGIEYTSVQGLGYGRIPVSLNSNERHRKHPVLCENSNREVILAWAEGTGWNKGGSVAWQVFNSEGRPIPGRSGRVDGLPAWSFVAVFSRRSGEFTIVY